MRYWSGHPWKRLWMARSNSRLPSVTSKLAPDLRRFIDRAREAFSGNGLNKLLTAGDLISSGVANPGPDRPLPSVRPSRRIGPALLWTLHGIGGDPVPRGHPAAGRRQRHHLRPKQRSCRARQGPILVQTRCNKGGIRRPRVSWRGGACCRGGETVFDVR